MEENQTKKARKRSKAWWDLLRKYQAAKKALPNTSTPEPEENKADSFYTHFSNVMKQEYLAIIRNRHKIGKLLLESGDRSLYTLADKSKGECDIILLADDYFYSRTEGFFCALFAKRYPDLEAFLAEAQKKERGPLTWRHIENILVDELEAERH